MFLITALILVASFVRLDRIEEITPGMYPDEIGVAQWGLKLLQGQELTPFIAGGYYHPTPLLYITGLSVETFGHTMTAIRLPNIIFGALSIGAFYILLRFFFPVPVALFGAVLMIFQYTHIIISRFSYEPIPSFFWQIVTIIFFILYWKKKDFLYLLGIAFSIGAGMYTYLNFRPFAALVFLSTIFLILKINWKQSLQRAGFFIIMVFVATMPLMSYFLIDSQGFSGRISDISIFSHNYTSSEFAKELGGNIFRIVILPFYQIPVTDPNAPPTSGDPNPRHNPATAPMFDLLTVSLGLLGLLYLFMKNRKLFWLLILFFLPPLLSDVFANERIPEFHYPGIGHPHAMRTSGFILTTLFAATAGLYWIYSRWGKERFAEVVTFLSSLLLVISYWNWHLYFDQMQVSPNAYLYNYVNNYTIATKTANYVNKLPGEKISLTKDIAETINFQFFINPKKNIQPFELTGTESAMMVIQESDVTAIGVTQKTIPILNGFNSTIFSGMGYTIQTLKNPLGQPDVVMIGKVNYLNFRQETGILTNLGE